VSTGATNASLVGSERPRAKRASSSLKLQFVGSPPDAFVRMSESRATTIAEVNQHRPASTLVRVVRCGHCSGAFEGRPDGPAGLKRRTPFVRWVRAARGENLDLRRSGLAGHCSRTRSNWSSARRSASHRARGRPHELMLVARVPIAGCAGARWSIPGGSPDPRDRPGPDGYGSPT